MKDKSQRVTMADVKNAVRGIKILYGIDKRYFWMQIFNAAGDTLRPFINSYLAALIINGITTGEEPKTLIIYAFLVVGINLVVNVMVQYTATRRYIRKSMWPRFLTRIFSGYSEKMDYERFEDAKIREQWYRIQNQLQSDGGMAYAPWNILDIVSSICGLGASVVLTVMMLTAKPTRPQTGILYFLTSPWVIIVFVVLLIVLAKIQSRTHKILDKAYKMQQDFHGKEKKRFDVMFNFAISNKNAMDTKIYGLDEIIKAETEEFGNKMCKLQRARGYQYALYDWLTSFINVVSKIFAYCIIGIKAILGAFEIGSVVLYVGTIQRFMYAIQRTNFFFLWIRRDRIAFEDQYSYIDMERKMYQGTLSVEKRSDRKYNVEFRNVSFKYPGCEEYALKNVNLKFNIGEKLAVVGMNGSGKTTFIKLMCRLYDPTEGEILLNGIDIRKYKYDEYMAIFSIVFQDFRLFAFSLAENVATSKDYDAERVEQCLREVGFGDRLETMPKGIETCLYRSYDSEGVEISGGEAQKIALARALYKNAPFIILDEPTAALDPLAEAEVYGKFNSIVGDKTAIYISHRLSSCRFCDKIAVFDHGSIVQTGTHNVLVADENGKYHELWHAQAQYYNEETA